MAPTRMVADGAALRHQASAKVNLTLHVTGRRADGYHLLDSLVVFPNLGDVIQVEPAAGLSLAISGPFAGELAADGNNLVLRAAERLAQAHGVGAGAAIRLDKHLPVASGIGGGSSDAATVLRLLARLWDVPVPLDLALSLGADVPVCLAAPKPQRMCGIGEQVTPVTGLPGFWMVLVNPRVGVPTGAVFSAMAGVSNPDMGTVPPGGFDDFTSLAVWLRCQRNDLQAPAIGICPAIGTVLQALSPAPVARMSGSGATCFGLFETQAQAIALADTLRAHHPEWWIAAGPVSP